MTENNHDNTEDNAVGKPVDQPRDRDETAGSEPVPSADSQTIPSSVDQDEPPSTDDRRSQPARDYVNGSGGDASIASLEQTTIQRDSDGEILPRREFVDELGPDGADVLAKPMPGETQRRYIDEKLLDGEDITDEDLAYLFNQYLVEPDLTNHPRCPNQGVSAEFIAEDMTGPMQDAYLYGILFASDRDQIVERLRMTSRGEADPQMLQLIAENPDLVDELEEKAQEREENETDRRNARAHEHRS